MLYIEIRRQHTKDHQRLVSRLGLLSLLSKLATFDDHTIKLRTALDAYPAPDHAQLHREVVIQCDTDEKHRLLDSTVVTIVTAQNPQIYTLGELRKLVP
jgi:hypothetical protein